MKYFMKKDSDIEPKAVKGKEVFSLRFYDYGLSSDDSRILGYPCQSMTLDSNGGYPSFTVPSHDLDIIKD